MSQQHKANPWKPVPAPLLEMPSPVGVPPKESAQIAQLIANGKSGPAVDFAKEVHKRCRNAASESLLVEAYSARIASLVDRGLEKEAQALLDLVHERYPSSRQRLQDLRGAIAARKGDLDPLLGLLNDPTLSAEKRAAIDQSIRRSGDLHALAACGSLSPEHSLRIAAAALIRAFEAATSGPVDESTLILPEVPRHSPLAPWKMLVRAVAAFYRRDDTLCEQCLAAIVPDSAPARLAPALRALMGRKQTLTPAALALLSHAGGSLPALRSALSQLDQAFDRRIHGSILQCISNAVAACQQAEPALLERLKQHIGVRGMMAGLKTDRVAAAMGGPSLKNAYFWRLLARAHEEEKGHAAAIPLACSQWAEFCKHAVREGWFPTQGPEVATVYLHMVDMLNRVPGEDLQDMRLDFARGFKGHAEYYQGQPPEIRALMPQRDGQDLYFLYPDALLDRACQADPCTENFQRWLRWTVQNEQNSDLVAAHWHAALPTDIPPLLHLMESAEKRNALKKAFKFMEEAEWIDGLNPEVRRARLRLLVSMAIRHLREKKSRLAEPELRQIEALPQAQQGDRPAFVAALRWVSSLLQDRSSDAARARAEVVRLLNSEVAAQIVLASVASRCGMKTASDTPPASVPMVDAVGRACALGDDMGAPFEIPQNLSTRLMQELSARDSTSDPPALAALCEAALRVNDYPLAYAASGAGLAHGAASGARFLLLRSRSLPPWEGERRFACIAAAAELARRQRDLDLLKRISEWREQQLGVFGPPDQAETAMTDAQIDDVIRYEKEEKAYSAARRRQAPRGECDCALCRAERGEMPHEIEDMVDQFGPEVVAQAISEIFGFGEERKRGKGRGRPDDKFPF